MGPYTKGKDTAATNSSRCINLKLLSLESDATVIKDGYNIIRVRTGTGYRVGL